MVTVVFVVPCLNEEEALPDTHQRLAGLLLSLKDQGRVGSGSRICYVDDGSTDGTWQVIAALSSRGPGVTGIRLSRNFGHQNALLAGMSAADGDAVITIDADLQDDISVIPEMLERFRQGCDIVYGVRRHRGTDGLLKRGSARLYYRCLRLLGVNVVPDHADFRLMSRRAIEALQQFSEVNLFLRGLVPLLGFRVCSVYYDRHSRVAGTTKYNLRRMLGLGLDGITSFSPVPLRIVSLVGFLVFLTTLAMMGWVLWVRLFTGEAVPGWASAVIPVYFLGGIQLLSLGIFGEYMAKMYTEIKRRPRYFVMETTGT